jgi:hypothetical protein
MKNLNWYFVGAIVASIVVWSVVVVTAALTWEAVIAWRTR